MSEKETCTWAYSETEDMWESGCGHLFEFNDGGPEDNDFMFCPYCGKALEENV